MHRLIISTVGTSLLTNKAEREDLRLLRETANARERDLDEQTRRRLESFLNKQLARLKQADPAEARNLSAELNGLLTIPEVLEGERFSKTVQHLLIATDTRQGSAAAKAVADWIRARGGLVQILSVQDLRTEELAEFRLALSDLARCLEEWSVGRRVLLNLTGGFKSVNAFLQALAMLKGWESVFLFEGARELMWIPRLPVDWNVEQAIRPYLPQLRRLRAKGELPSAELEGVPGTLLFEVEKRASLSEWGNVLLNEATHSLYRERLLEPAIPELRYAEAFRKEAERLAKDDLAKLNAQLDKLARWVATNRSDKLKSLDTKKLRGNPLPPSTHECDAWTGTGKRLVGHFEEDSFVVDRLADHL